MKKLTKAESKALDHLVRVMRRIRAMSPNSWLDDLKRQRSRLRSLAAKA